MSKKFQLPVLNKSSPTSLFRHGSSSKIYLQEETNTIKKIDETIERIDLELESPIKLNRSRI